MSHHEKSKVESLVGTLLLSNTAMSTNLKASIDFACPLPRCLFKKERWMVARCTTTPFQPLEATEEDRGITICEMLN
jgi:hypothetical protein